MQSLVRCLISTLVLLFGLTRAATFSLQTADAVFLGERAGDFAGNHMSIIPDVNCDGIDDVLIASTRYDYNDKTDCGKIYLFYGKTSGWSQTINLSEADASFLGEKGDDRAGHDLFGIGDVNGDDMNDFAIGVKYFNGILRDKWNLDIGKTYIFFGSPNGWGKNVNLNDADVKILGENHANQAGHVNGLGDANGDGFDDIIIGGPFNDQVGPNSGKAYIMFGKATEEWGENLSVGYEDASFLAATTGEWAAHRVAGLGDVNGDSLGDFVAGANKRNHNGVFDVGACYIMFGKTGRWGWDNSFSDADVTFLGSPITLLELGFNVAAPGDVNGDGLNDILLGGQGKSRVFLVLGRSSNWPQNAVIDNAAEVVFLGESASDKLGFDMRSLGDINKDGYDDFIIGAYQNSDAGDRAGKAYLFLGRESWPQKYMSITDADISLTGENAGDYAGWSVAGGGDINGDGQNDVLVSAIKNSDNGDEAGKVYLFFNLFASITVNQPNGSEIIPAATDYEIQWESNKIGDMISIDYSPDDGATWTTIAENTANDGSYLWHVPLITSDSCLVRISDAASGTADQSDALFSIAKVQHFTPVWQNPATDPMTFYCAELAYLDALEENDEIGVFDDSSCVGVFQISETPLITPFEIICSKDDGSGNGFTPGHTAQFKFWDASQQKEANAFARYLDCQTAEEIAPPHFQDHGSACIHLTAPARQQMVQLSQGWNIFSLALVPQYPFDLLALLDPESHDIHKVLDETGKPIEKVIGNWYNFIGDWQATEGYYVKVDQNVELPFQGTDIPTPLEIDLNPGWNIISYVFLNNEQNALDVIQPLIDQGVLEKVMDERGQSIEQLLGSWHNFIGTMRDGEGYYVKVSAACTLTERDLGSSVTKTAIAAPAPLQHFRAPEDYHPFQPMSVYICDAKIDGESLVPGDEIAICKNGRVVNAAVWQKNSQPQLIPVGSGDSAGNGLVEDDIFAVKIWQHRTNNDMSVPVKNIHIFDTKGKSMGQAPVFEPMASCLMDISVKNNITQEVPADFTLYRNYPNPFNSSTTISYDLPTACHLSLRIYDVNGHLVNVLQNGHQTAGHHSISWDGTNRTKIPVVSGLYFVQLQAEGFERVGKVMVVR